MNERDYKLMEIMVICAGIFTSLTIALMMLAYGILPDVGIFIAMSFIGFVTFFFGLYFHMKHRIFVLEMKELAKDHTDPERGGSEK